jgi:hypothetical protein
MRKHIPWSSFWRLLLAAFFVLLLMKPGALPMVAQAPSPTPGATATVSAGNATDKKQESVEPVDIRLQDLGFLLIPLTRPPLLFIFSFTLAMFLTAFVIGVIPFSLWKRLIGLAPPPAEATTPPQENVRSTAAAGQGAAVQQTPGAPEPPAVVERQPGSPQQPAPSPQPPNTAGGQGQQQGQSPPQEGTQAAAQQGQQGATQQGQAQQGGRPAQPGAAQQGAQGQVQRQARGQAQAQGQGSQSAQQQQQGGQGSPVSAPQADQGALQALLGNQEGEEDVPAIDEEIQNILSGVFGEEEGVDPHLEFLATLLKDVNLEELQKTLQQVSRLLQRKKRK